MCGKLVVERLGALVDGVVGRLSAPESAIIGTAYFCLWVLGSMMVRALTLLMVLGRLVRIFEFRRAIMVILNECWVDSQTTTTALLTNQMRTELLVSCCLLQLAFTNLRAEIEGAVTCSDASLLGGGCCISSGLTSLGKEPLQQKERVSRHWARKVMLGKKPCE